MKTILILITTIFIANSSAWAQPIQAGPIQAGSDQYKQAMSQAIGTMQNRNQQSSVSDFMATANQFERIASAEPKEWLPRYYAGLNYVYMALAGQDKTEAEKDKYLDQADSHLKAAEAIAPNNDELAVLRAYIAQGRLVVDPMNRWQQYGPLAQASLDKAKSLNPNNPRPYVLEGTSLMFTPEQFGGGPGTACPVLKQAAEKFATFKPASDIAPNWGQKQIEPMLAKCAK